MKSLRRLRDFPSLFQGFPDRPLLAAPVMLCRDADAMMYAATEKESVLMALPPPLRVLIVDDSAIFLNQLEKWLSGCSGFEVIGKANSGMDAIDQSRVLRPDLVVMDVAMPLMNGFEAAVRIKEGVHRPTVILISFFDIEDAYRDSGPKADAFIMKDSLYEELLPTVARLFPLRWEQAAADRSMEERRSHGV